MERTELSLSAAENNKISELPSQEKISEKQYGYTIVLDTNPGGTDGQGYQDTALPFAGKESELQETEKIPERIRKMRRLFEYGGESVRSRAGNFYRQAVFMQDFEDDYPWKGDFFHYFPTYHDLDTRQLRGYFTWRARLRKGDFQKIPTSAAYIYVYELLNGVGAASPEESLQKLKEFESGYVSSGIGDAGMQMNLRRWMQDYAVLHALPAELAQQYADPYTLRRDQALSVLKSPADHTDEEVTEALFSAGGKYAENSPLLARSPERGRRLFAECWRKASVFCLKDKDLFTLCFGERRKRQWFPLANAVYFQQSEPEDADYELNESRSYHCRNGMWQVEAYEKLSFDLARYKSFLHETEAKLRRYLKTGNYLKENPADEWAAPYIDQVILEDKNALIEASRPKITIDLTSLPKIRSDAGKTRDSLLTEEERAEGPEDMQEINAVREPEAGETVREENFAGTDTAGPLLSLEPVQVQILHALLKGEDVSEMIRAGRLMPSVIADRINEALFDEIGDTVLLCENDRLMPVEEYSEDLKQLFGGTDHG